MTQEDRELLLKDLCARLPYKLICSIYREDDEGVGWRDAICKGYYYSDYDYEFYFEDVVAVDNIQHIKPYLRPLSSMTEEERNELIRFGGIVKIDTSEIIDISCLGFKHHANNQDWLNKHHFDYRGLIERDLAIEAPEWMYK